MIHGRLSDSQIADLPVRPSSFNFKVENGTHVTLSGYAGDMEKFLQDHPDFVKMKLTHPWHHPDYQRFRNRLTRITSSAVAEGAFVSGVTTRFETRLEDDYWHDWLVSLSISFAPCIPSTIGMPIITSISLKSVFIQS